LKALISESLRSRLALLKRISWWWRLYLITSS